MRHRRGDLKKHADPHNPLHEAKDPIASLVEAAKGSPATAPEPAEPERCRSGVGLWAKRPPDLGGRHLTRGYQGTARVVSIYQGAVLGTFLDPKPCQWRLGKWVSLPVLTLNPKLQSVGVGLVVTTGRVLILRHEV